MAAYAALVSLINTIDQIQNHRPFSSSLDNKQIESLGEKVGYILDFIESHSHGGSQEAQILESQIASAAYAAEDVIETHIVDQINAGSISLLDLQALIQDMDSIKEKVMEVTKKRGFQKHQHPTYLSHAPISSTSSLSSIKKSSMVGFDDELARLLDELTGQRSNQQIIPIVGMGGSGKTTLAINVYENSLIVQHFDIRAWATISQEYSVREIFVKLLSFHKTSTCDKFDQKTEDQLAQQLYQSLIGRRYLIILDDMWSIEVWNKIKFFFPDNNNRSRIMITTRLSNVAIHFGPSYLSMKFLDEEKSWNLFCENAFVQESCPIELKKIARKIAEKCKGLPLTIVVIGALLRNSSRIQEYWKNISKDINSVMVNSGEDEQSLDILSLSYSHLPAHLKSCFLYMGIFPEDDEINVSLLIKVWVAEGFIKQNKTQTMEEVAEGYIKDLNDRNLILVGRLGLNRKIKTCKIHDLLRD